MNYKQKAVTFSLLSMVLAYFSDFSVIIWLASFASLGYTSMCMVKGIKE